MGGKDLAGRPCRSFVRAGVGFVPEDRLGTGLAGSETIWRNAIMRRYGADQLTRGPLLDQGASRDGEEGCAGEAVGRELGDAVRALSGGHAQRLLTGREMEVGSQILILFPTRGLDVSAAAYLRETILDARDRGIAVLFVAEELDEILEMSDRVVVLYEGRINAEFEIDREVGRAMGGAPGATAHGRAERRRRRDRRLRTLPVAHRAPRQARGPGSLPGRLGRDRASSSPRRSPCSTPTWPSQFFEASGTAPSASRPASSTCSP